MPNPRDPLSALGFQGKKRKNDEFCERENFIFQPLTSLISIFQIPLKLQNRPPSPDKNTKHCFGFKLKPLALPERCLLKFPTLREIEWWRRDVTVRFHVTVKMIRLGRQGVYILLFLQLHSIYCNSRDDSPRDFSITIKSIAQYTRSERQIGIIHVFMNYSE